MNLLSKDIINLSPFSSDGAPISASEVNIFLVYCTFQLILILYDCILGLPSWAQLADAVDER